MDIKSEASPILRQFISYHETIRGHSKKTADEYFLDLRLFFRFVKQHRGLTDAYEHFNDIPIDDVDLPFIRSITLQDVYAFMSFLSRERPKQQNSQYSEYGLGASSRARKVATIRSFFKYLTVKAHLLQENPVQDLDSPKPQKKLPRYLNLDESLTLLDTVAGRFEERDYCIITLFLNCGLRISELVGINLSDIQGDTLRVLGKGNKERVVFLNEACLQALATYLPKRKAMTVTAKDEKALFLSQKHNRIHVQTVHITVKKHLLASGLDASRYSSHKLRHTAATLVLQNGVDIRTLQEMLGHDHLNTTQIYTHVENAQLREAASANPLSRVKKS